MKRSAIGLEGATETLTRRAAREPESGAGWVVVALGETAQSARAVPARAEIIVGRGSAADLRIDDVSVSREHVRLRFDGTVTLSDLGSHNGTRIGLRELTPNVPVPLQPGELVTLGRVTLLVQKVGGEPTPLAFGPARAVPRDAGAPPGFVRTAALAGVLDVVDRVADASIPVLLLGETGVGKEIVAELLHGRSQRRKGPFVRLHCAAITPALFESELFGHERGAFTGADRQKPGLLETADGGTVLIDEVGELPEATQVKLLRVLEDRKVMRVGATEGRTIDVRFVAATNRDLDAEVEAGRFRRDLYYRLAGLVLRLPPLREQRAELSSLAKELLRHAAERNQLHGALLGEEAERALAAHDWPGNVRELKTALERALLLAGGATITPEHLQLGPARSSRSVPPAADPEARRIQEALTAAAGNQKEAARILGISRRTLLNRLDQFAIPRPRKKSD